MSKLAVFVRPTWKKGALPIGVAQYHLTRALLVEPQKFLFSIRGCDWKLRSRDGGLPINVILLSAKNGWFELKKTIQIDDLSVLPFEETSGSEGTIRGKALHILEDLGVNKHQ